MDNAIHYIIAALLGFAILASARQSRKEGRGRLIASGFPNRMLLVALLILIVVPLNLFLWASLRILETREVYIQQRFDELLNSKIGDIHSRIQGVASEWERFCLALTGDLPVEPDTLRQLAREDGRVAAVFRISAEGELLYPRETDSRPLTREEAEFLRRSGLIWRDQLLSHRPPQGEARSYLTTEAASPMFRSHRRHLRSAFKSDDSNSQRFGWFAWHFEHGLHLIFWRELGSGETVGLELNRSRFLADLIAALPDGAPVGSPTEGRMALLGADGEVIYQWGAYEPEEGATPYRTASLSPPLASWELAWYGEGPALGLSGSTAFLTIAGLLLFVVLFIQLALYFYRESSRELREAGQRVNFVGQVSHELKTPLTNIRMYAELLENELDEDNAEARKDLSVIVSESRRLSRLIGNILTFSRRDRDALRLRLTPGVLDDAVRDTVEHFRPLLESKGVAIELDLNAPGETAFDRDVVEQIVGNLLSNVEKYAASGQKLTVATRRDNGRSIITVADEGPGIPRAEREKIFEPFYRISDKLTDGVAGTGLGLSLSRELARLHGGDLILLDSQTGARFEITLAHTAPAEAIPS